MMLRERGRAVWRSGSGDATRARCLLVEQVDRREWNIQRITAQDLGRVTASEFGAPLLRRPGAEIAQRREPPHADDPPGGLGASAENALDRPAVITQDRAIAEGGIDLLARQVPGVEHL